MGSRVGFLVIWEGQSHRNPLLGCAGTIVNTDVFFSKVSLFRLVGDFKVPRVTLGPHFERFLGTWGSILVVRDGPGDR